MNLPGSNDTPTPASGVARGTFLPDPPAAPSGDGLFASPMGWTNGCCDPDYLAPLPDCQEQNYPYHWYLFNYGWTFVNTTSDIVFRGTARSAEGTSTFNVSVSSGAGGVWSVFEGTWRQFMQYL
jgi:hypothetical protein